jgi:hypothetical protein
MRADIEQAQSATQWRRKCDFTADGECVGRIRAWSFVQRDCWPPMKSSAEKAVTPVGVTASQDDHLLA